MRTLIIRGLIGAGFSLVGIGYLAHHTVLGAALGALGGKGAPTYISAGVPFVVHDRYGTQLCVSTGAGRPLLPFVVPADAYGNGGPVEQSSRVQAGVPFVVREGSSTQICVSTRGGYSFPPFIMSQQRRPAMPVAYASSSYTAASAGYTYPGPT